MTESAPADRALCYLQGTLAFILYFPHLLFCWLQDFWGLLTRSRKDVTDKVVVITGAAQGLGKEMARIFSLQLGAVVVLLDRDRQLNEKTAEEIRISGGRAHAFECDVSDADNMRSVAEDVKAEVGNVDIVISNAGILELAPVSKLTDEQIKRMISINLLGCFWTIRAFLDGMLDSNSGHICAVSSVGGHFGEVCASAYSAAKFGIRGLMESLEYELLDAGKNGVKLTTLYPYFVQTGLIKDCDPSSRYFPLLTTEECASVMVDDILTEKLEGFVPRYCSVLCTTVKSIMTYKAKLASRNFLAIRYYSDYKL